MVNTFVSALLGISFAVLGTATVFLMFHLWGYPFDKVARKSEAPKSLMLLHRVMGFAFLGLYVFMMVQMVPRLVSYQVEFPARTVAHIILGVTVGFLLLVKISIIRFFRHLARLARYLRWPRAETRRTPALSSGGCARRWRPRWQRTTRPRLRQRSTGWRASLRHPDRSGRRSR